MNSLAGTGPLIRLILRRDRFIIPAWVIVFGMMPMIVANAFEELYPAPQEVVTAAHQVGSNAAFLALFGPVFSPTIGGLVAWRLSIFHVIIAVVSVLTIIRHTRVEEETGRRELIGSTVVGRHAQLASALVTVAAADLVVAVLVAAGLTVAGLPATGSMALGMAIAATGIIFAAVGALAAQLTETAGGARAIGLSVVGLAFVLRAAGDASGGGTHSTWPSWLSPIGWAIQIRSFGDERWWLLGLIAAVAALIVLSAFALASKRDVGAGVLPPRLGPASAAAGLASPLALAWRLHRGALVGWAVAFAVLGTIYGSVAEGVGDLLVDNPDLREIFERLGGKRAIIDGYFTGIAGVFALIAAAYAIQATSRARAEEEELRAEPVLATSATRTSWVTSHLVFGLAGPAIALVAAGLAAGLSYGLVAGDVGGQLVRIVAATTIQAPAVWILVGVTMLLFGVAPRMMALSWVTYSVMLLLTLLGTLLQLSHWILDLSPFTHPPKLPGGEVAVVPIVWLLGLVAVMCTAGVFGFRRRDVGP